MKNLFAATLFAITLGQPALAQTKEIAERATWLRKASLILQGQDADSAAYGQMASVTNEQWSAHQKQQLEQIFASDQFKKKMNTEIIEHLGLPAESQRYDENIKYPSSQYIKNILSGSAPWSSLFNSRDVYMDPKSPRDVHFYKRIFGGSLPVADYSFKDSNGQQTYNYVRLSAKSEEQKDALAGFFTTPEFFSRYFNTGTNENRKRAAALYRLLLCDEMKPVILSDAHLERELLMSTISDLKDGQQQPAPPATVADQHGSQPDCQVCHRKLDPAAKLFSAAPMSPALKSMSSFFVLGQQSQSILGLGQWVDAALKTDSAKRCQVRFFWNFVIGKNVPLSEDTMQNLVKVYDSSRENVRVLIEKLILMPEFTMPAQQLEERPVTFGDVRPLLRRCDSCHAGEGHMPDFASLPIGFQASEHSRWLKKIVKETDLENLGAKAAMPPAKAGWKPSTMEYRMLAKWLADGARDERGVPTTNEVIIASKPKLGVAEPTFLPTFRRFLRTRDLDGVTLHGYGGSSCFGYSTRNEPSMTAIETGSASFHKIAPVLEVAGPGYYTFVARCVVPGLVQKFSHSVLDSGEGQIKLDAPEVEALANQIFEMMFGKYRFYGETRAKMIDRVVGASKQRRKSAASVAKKDLYNDFITGFASMPQFLVY